MLIIYFKFNDYIRYNVSEFTHSITFIFHTYVNIDSFSLSIEFMLEPLNYLVDRFWIETN